jgi:hypothetical protein
MFVASSCVQRLNGRPWSWWTSCPRSVLSNSSTHPRRRMPRNSRQRSLTQEKGSYHILSQQRVISAQWWIKPLSARYRIIHAPPTCFPSMFNTDPHAHGFHANNHKFYAPSHTSSLNEEHGPFLFEQEKRELSVFGRRQDQMWRDLREIRIRIRSPSLSHDQTSDTSNEPRISALCTGACKS